MAYPMAPSTSAVVFTWPIIGKVYFTECSCSSAVSARMTSVTNTML